MDGISSTSKGDSCYAAVSIISAFSVHIGYTGSVFKESDVENSTSYGYKGHIADHLVPASSPFTNAFINRARSKPYRFASSSRIS